MKILRSKRVGDEWVDFEDEMTEVEEKEFYINQFSEISSEYIDIKSKYDDCELLPDSMLKTMKLGKLGLELQAKEKEYNDLLNGLLVKYGEEVLNVL